MTPFMHSEECMCHLQNIVSDYQEKCDWAKKKICVLTVTCWKKLGSVGRKYIFINFILYNWIDVGWHLECISTLQKWHLTRFCLNNDPLDIKNYIRRQK